MHCFGQASLHTGAMTDFKVEALTRSVVYEIAEDDLAPILKARPAIAAELGRLMAIRQAAYHLAFRLGDRVKALFGLAP